MNSVEKYEIKKQGYHPVLIREGWQIAQLNADENQKVNNITKLDIHYQTDEVFILLKGSVVLITGTINPENQPLIETELMKQGITYNIPKNTWHNIAMEDGSEVLIVEKSNTHLSDFEFYQLTEEQQKELRKKVGETLRNKR